jgi:hypothetical protein
MLDADVGVRLGRQLREHNLAVHEQLREVSETLQNAASSAEAWEAARSVAPALELAEFTIAVSAISPADVVETTRFEWRTRTDECIGERVEFGLPVESDTGPH